MKRRIFLLMLLSTLLFTGCANSPTETGFEESDAKEAEDWINETDDSYYVEWVYVNDACYGIEGSIVSKDEIPDGWKSIGSITQRVSDSEPVAEENYTSNTFRVGKEIYANDESPDTIYVQSVTESGSYVEMVRLEEVTN